MTALAVALVLCCAMACGTVLVLRRAQDSKELSERLDHHATRLGDATKRAADIEARLLALEVAAHVVTDERVAMKTAHEALRSELESLRASVALRSV